MENKKSDLVKVLPVLFGFFIMGFCDVVGISTSYFKRDFQLTETIANLLPTMLFLWFLLLSVPSALLMNVWGRKKTVLLSMVITFIAMLIPFVRYDFITCLIAFALLGIGNTILQVSLNPLLTNVVKGNALTSSLTAGQVIKAISSFSGPFIAIFAVSYFGSWQYIFPIFAVLTILSGVWLLLTPIHESSTSIKSSSVKGTFSLLTDKTVLLLFLGILFVVGTDVGINIVTPKLLIERCGLDISKAGFGSSVYFAFRTIGAFFGAFMLVKFSEIKYFRINIIISLLTLIILFYLTNQIAILVAVGLIGFTCSSIFSIIFSLALQLRPEKANELSGLMITAIVGGALIPPLMGVVADSIGSQNGSLFIILICMCYLVFCSFWLKTQNKKLLV
jgi:fucose permease